MGFMGDNGEYTGFDLELAQEVAKRLGLTYTPQPIAWDSGIWSWMRAISIVSGTALP